MRQVRILHVFGCMNRGGAEMRTLDVMRHIDRSRYVFDFCTLSGAPGDLDSEIEELGGRVLPCPLGAEFPVAFVRLLRRERFDVVHSHVHYFSGPILLLAAMAGIRTRICHFRIAQDLKNRTRVRSAQERLSRTLISTWATDILAVSEATMTSAWGADWRRDSRCQVIYNGLDTAPFAMLRNDGDLRSEFGVPASAHLYLHVGRMDPQKNHLRLLGMFKEVLALDSRAHLLLAGRGGDGEAEIRRRVTELELERCVTFAGLRCDIPALMGAADVLLLPSLQEGLPGVVLEACAAGLPVVASNLGGALEIQESFDAVACCSLADDDRIWAKAIVEARTHRIHRDARPTALRRFEQSPFALDRCVSQLASIWKAAPA